MARKLFAEWLGTFFLLAVVVGSGIMADRLSGGNSALALLGNTIPTGAILYVMILILGPVSGAHFNPAVTFAFLLSNKISIKNSIAYIIFQILGGITGVIIAHLMFQESIFQTSTTLRTGGDQWISEFVATFGLVTTILGAVRYRPESIAMAVGLFVTAGYWFTASTCFANPAVTIARAFTDTFAGINPYHAPIFILTQFVAAAVAMLVCNWLFSSKINS